MQCGRDHRDWQRTEEQEEQRPSRPTPATSGCSPRRPGSSSAYCRNCCRHKDMPACCRCEHRASTTGAATAPPAAEMRRSRFTQWRNGVGRARLRTARIATNMIRPAQSSSEPYASQRAARRIDRSRATLAPRNRATPAAGKIAVYEHQTPTIDAASKASHAAVRSNVSSGRPTRRDQHERHQEIDRIRLHFGGMPDRIKRGGQHGDRQQDGPPAGDLAAESPEQQERPHARQIRDQPQRPFAGAKSVRTASHSAQRKPGGAIWKYSSGRASPARSRVRKLTATYASSPQSGKARA